MVTINAIGTDTGAVGTVLTGNGVGVTPTFQAGAGGGDVTAAGNLTDDYVVTGDGGAKGVQTSSMKIDASGQMTNTSQPAFFASLAATRANVTGDAFDYDVVWGVEKFDQNGDFDNVKTFTAPITGRYFFIFQCAFGDLAAANTGGFLAIKTSNNTFYLDINPGVIESTVTSTLTLSLPTFCDMDAADTSICAIAVSGGTRIIDVLLVGATDPRSWFQGFLVC